MNSLIIKFFIIGLVIWSIISTLTAQNVVNGYEYLWIHPLSFLLVYLLIFIPLLKLNKFKITLYSFIILAGFRYVFIPLGSSISGVYNGVNYINVSEKLIVKSVFLSTYELYITSFFMLFLVFFKSKKANLITKESSKELILRGNKAVYAIFILISALIYLIIGKNLNLINFFVLSADTGERFGDLSSTTLILVRQIFIISFIFSAVWFISFCKKKFDITKNKIYINFAILAAILNIGIIIGERRTAQLYTALVLTFILINTFKKQKKRIILFISVAATSVLLFMSIYKHLAAFAYGSYLTAVNSSQVDIEFITVTLQSYFFGTQNIAAVLEFSNYSNLNFVNFLYDMGRSIFGLNFILKDKMEITSQLFNTFIYGVKTNSGHVISGVGYGYIFFGSLFAPLIVCMNILISIKLEEYFNKIKSFEMKYIIGYILVRFSTNIFATTPPLVSLATMMLFTAGSIYLIARLLNDRTLIRRQLPYKKENKNENIINFLRH